ncbi:hypothetical protein AVEN_215921-1 [Araneus ventricosus]|uniref:Uncharacterized protein n=1 Tax=Araneus ventricosus TaxID=182803 RepID=A0A4Y2HEG9_ARAVE|nr:hypothetical protein AVEN_215921-1 [Araneus ventricosus]
MVGKRDLQRFVRRSTSKYFFCKSNNKSDCGSLQNGELFSYIGGLIGCWLGISVWAFTSICEKFVGKLSTLKRNYRLIKEQASSEAKDV